MLAINAPVIAFCLFIYLITDSTCYYLASYPSDLSGALQSTVETLFFSFWDKLKKEKMLRVICRIYKCGGNDFSRRYLFCYRNLAYYHLLSLSKMCHLEFQWQILIVSYLFLFVIIEIHFCIEEKLIFVWICSQSSLKPSNKQKETRHVPVTGVLLLIRSYGKGEKWHGKGQGWTVMREKEEICPPT